MTSTTKVLIVGAGPVGLTLAVELARRDVPFKIIDSKERPTDQSRALGVQARTLEHLENLGVVGKFLDRGRKVSGIQASDHGKTIFEVKLDLDASQTPYPFVIVLPQSETERILIERLTELGAAIDWRTSLQAFSQSDAGVRATVANEKGDTASVNADWIVGCDGAHSGVRHGLNVTFEGAAYPESFLLADVTVDWNLPQDRLHILLMPDGALPAFPLPGEKHWRLVDTSGKFESNDPEVVVKHFEGLLKANGFPEITVSNPTWVASFRVHRRLAGALRQGRAFLAGDAAHIHSPAGGQGMNTGIQDACNLGWKLALVVQGKAPRSLLDSYSPERLPVVAGVLKGTDGLTKIVTLQNRWLKALRNHLASVVTSFSFVQRKISLAMSELDVNYRKSPIIGQSWEGSTPEGFKQGPLPGRRVPDVMFGSQRLFDKLQGINHTLLLFDAASTNPETLPRFRKLAERLRDRYGPLISTVLISRSETASWEGTKLLDDGKLHENFGASEPSIYLIRPDHYVGFRSKTSHGAPLEAYLKTLLV